MRLKRFSSFCSGHSYCVTATGARKLIFGRGVKLTTQSKEQYEPEVYELSDTKTNEKVCLATGFTRHNLMKDWTAFSGTEASQIVEDGKPTGVYNQVAVLEAGQECGNTTEKADEPCAASLEPDEMVNLASLTVFGLRVIFMKTVVFNVLMTLRLWISQ
ncbi:T-cell receptor alpha chain constant isoform 4-T4 [Fundulus diaphanus]